MIVVAYTTLYREGGHSLRLAAETLARARRAEGATVVCQATESKRAFVDLLLGQDAPIAELHVVAHGGLYGPMFGTTALPEQLSPHEWRHLASRSACGTFASGAEAFFHACRSGRWFAPFFARTFGRPAWGHHWYTTVSRRSDRYRWVRPGLPQGADVYVVGQRGRRSHGVLGSVAKHAGLLPPTPMVRHLPETALDGPAYERVADLYDRTFADLSVRASEVGWLRERVPAGAAVLDLGCGTGGLLRLLAADVDVARSAGADVSGAMLAHARRRDGRFSWATLCGPELPYDDDQFDVVTSLLSWRYLDWDPVLAEIARVLRPGGRLLVVDMVATPAAVVEWPRVARDGIAAAAVARRTPGFRAARTRMVADPAWQSLLHYNPMRAEHEYRWFFESRFPGASVDVLNVARRSRMLGVDTGPITTRWFPPQSYP